MENEKEIFDFYNGGAEIGRLESGLGMVEFYRSKEIISRYIDKACVVYDIGGGVGKYSEWLAENGHTVTMVELAPAAVEYAVKNMKTPCDLISIYDDYTDDQVENLAKCLDASLGQNYFSTLYQLLGDKFLPFLDVFQEDKFNIPSTSYIKNLLTDLSILEDHEDGLSVADLSNKYDKTPTVIERILKSKDVLKP